MTQQVSSARPASRGRLRRVLPLLVAAWLVLEIWLLTVVADVAGWGTVLLLLIAGAFLGGALIKRAGRRALAAAFAQTRDPQPAQPQTGTSLTVLGGLLLIMPGFLSDLVGLSLLLPPTRALWRALGRRLTRNALRRSAAGFGSGTFTDAMRLQEQLRIHRPDGRVVQGEVVDPDGPPRGDGGPDATYRPPLGS